MTLQQKIGDRVKELRIDSNKTQFDVANCSNLDKSFVNKVENARVGISIRSLQKIIVDGLGMTIHDFFNDYRFMQNH